MAGRRRAFRECDLASALQVAKKHGAGEVRIDPRTGEITIALHGKSDAEKPQAESDEEPIDWEVRRAAKAEQATIFGHWREERLMARLVSAGVGVSVRADTIYGCGPHTSSKLAKQGFLYVTEDKRAQIVLTEAGLKAFKRYRKLEGAGIPAGQFIL